jgi:hypothetical protein
MLARESPVFPLRWQVIGGAALISLALCLLLPVLALLCWLGGVIGWAVLWIVIGLLFALFYALLIGGVLFIVGGIFWVIGGSNENDRAIGCGFIAGGPIVIIIGVFTSAWWGIDYRIVSASSNQIYSYSSSNASSLLYDVWIGDGIVWLVWVVLLVALIAAGIALLAIILLRIIDWSRGPLGGVYYACPNGHRGGVAFSCPSCGQWEDFLRPSVYGVLSSICECGQLIPTCDLVGRSELGKRCRSCSYGLDHPGCGKLPEYHIAVWEPIVEEGRVNWLTAAIRELATNGARVSPSQPPANANPLPALLISGDECGNGLTYIYSISGGGPDALQPTAEEYNQWLSGFVLVFTLPADSDTTGSGPDKIVAGLLNFWDRIRVGRSGGRHSATLAMVVRWEGSPRDAGRKAKSVGMVTDSDQVRAAIATAGFENLARALESRFQRVVFFALNAPASNTTLLMASPSATLACVCRQLS